MGIMSTSFLHVFTSPGSYCGSHTGILEWRHLFGDHSNCNPFIPEPLSEEQPGPDVRNHLSWAGLTSQTFAGQPSLGTRLRVSTYGLGQRNAQANAKLTLSCARAPHPPTHITALTVMWEACACLPAELLH